VSTRWVPVLALAPSPTNPGLAGVDHHLDPAAGVFSRALPPWLAWPAVVPGIAQLTQFGFLASMLGLLWAAVAGTVLPVRTLDRAASALSSADPDVGRPSGHARSTQIASGAAPALASAANGAGPGPARLSALLGRRNRMQCRTAGSPRGRAPDCRRVHPGAGGSAGTQGRRACPAGECPGTPPAPARHGQEFLARPHAQPPGMTRHRAGR
jgi:hypothetical protein